MTSKIAEYSHILPKITWIFFSPKLFGKKEETEQKQNHTSPSSSIVMQQLGKKERKTNTTAPK